MCYYKNNIFCTVILIFEKEKNMIPRIIIQKEMYETLCKEIKLDKKFDLNDKLTRIALKSAIRKLFVKEIKRIEKMGLTVETMELDTTIVYIVVKNPMVLGKYPLYQLALGYFKCGKSIENKDCTTFLMGLQRMAEKNHFSLEQEMKLKIKKWKGKIK